MPPTRSCTARPATCEAKCWSAFSGGDFEAELRRIYDRARTLDEVTAELRALRDRVAERAQALRGGPRAHRRPHRAAPRWWNPARVPAAQQRVPVALAELDRDLLEVVTSWLDASGHPSRAQEGDEDELLHVAPSPHLPEDLREGTVAAIGASKEHPPLSLGSSAGTGRSRLHRAACRHGHGRGRDAPKSAEAASLTRPARAPAARQARRSTASRRSRLLVPVLLLEGWATCFRPRTHSRCCAHR